MRQNHTGLGVGPKSNVNELLREKDAQETPGGRSCEDRAKDWYYAAANQGVPEKLKKVREFSYLQPLEGVWLC